MKEKKRIDDSRFSNCSQELKSSSGKLIIYFVLFRFIVLTERTQYVARMFIK